MVYKWSNEIVNISFKKWQWENSSAASTVLASGSAVSVVKQLTVPLTCINNILKLIPATRTVSQDLVLVVVLAKNEVFFRSWLFFPTIMKQINSVAFFSGG